MSSLFEKIEEDKKIKNFLDYQLNTLTTGQRMVFIFIVLLLLIFAIFGNCATLFVNSKRKFRPLFRAFLLSLAFSDLVTAIFTAVVYLSQFSSDFPQIWHLGVLMCGLVPFLQTSAIIANSMTLVGIALDRYLAVTKAVKWNWEPGNIFCGTCVILIWGLSTGISSPMISSYTAIDAYIILTNPTNPTQAEGLLPVKMCVSDKNNTSYYYVIVFTIVFLPSVIAFLLLNWAIAREIWARRFFNRNLSSGAPQKDNSKNGSSSTLTTGQASCKQQNTGNASINPSCKPVLKQRTTREIRQFRMLCIIFLLMVIFLVSRLPTWVFLIMKLYGNYREIAHWILHFCFGTLSLASCVLNPLLYTFMTGTIHYSLAIRSKLGKGFRWCRGACRGRNASASAAPASDNSNADGKCHPGSSNGEIYTIFGDK